MTTLRKALLGTAAGLGLLALAATPVLAGAADGGVPAGRVQLAHMGQGSGGQAYGGRGYGSAPCPGMGMMGPGMGMMGPGMGMMGPGMGMMGPGMGMMGSGMGMMGPGHGYGPPSGMADKDLSADDIRKRLERSLAWHGNKRLKVGEVKEVDEDTIVADIVTLDDSLVHRLEVDRHSGWSRQVE